MANEVSVTMKRARETKRTFRYEEVVADGQEATIGTLYVPKIVLGEMGGPEEITVTVAPKV